VRNGWSSKKNSAQFLYGALISKPSEQIYNVANFCATIWMSVVMLRQPRVVIGLRSRFFSHPSIVEETSWPMITANFSISIDLKPRIFTHSSLDLIGPCAKVWLRLRAVLRGKRQCSFGNRVCSAIVPGSRLGKVWRPPKARLYVESLCLGLSI
jgi:hypothetical protein